jgi:hypothetical protein
MHGRASTEPLGTCPRFASKTIFVAMPRQLEMRQTSKKWLILPPIISFLKDIIAAVVLLSTEPGITAKAKFYYSLSLLPGALFVNDAMPSVFVNLLFAELVGGAIYLGLRFERAWLLIVPPLILLFKDMLAMTIAMLLNQPGTATTTSRFYSIAMLPGSAFHRLMEPIFFNVLFAALAGLGLYLYIVRRHAVIRG